MIKEKEKVVMLHDTPARDSYMYQSKYSRSFGGIAASTIRGGMPVEYMRLYATSVRPSVRIMMTIDIHGFVASCQ